MSDYIQVCPHGYTEKCPVCRAEAEDDAKDAEIAALRADYDTAFRERNDALTACLRYEGEIAALKAEPMVPLRPQLAAFASAMESTLKANDHKGGWEDETSSWLFRRLLDETGELRRAVFSGDRIATKDEAVDVANFAMMIYDVAAIRAAREGAGA